MTTVDKLERLLTLTEVLLGAERPVAVEELRQKVPGYAESDAAFRRTFERDKDDLRELGIPIEVVDVPRADPPTRGYVLRREDYFLRDPGLDPEELAALHLALQLVQVDGASGDTALWAFGGAPSDRDASPDTPIASLPGDPRLPVMLDAIGERAPLSFDYRSRDGSVRRRTVDPRRIEYLKGHWYLTAHDHERDALRHFRVDRIADQALTRGTPGSFPVPDTVAPPMPSEAWRYGDAAPVRAQVLVDAPYAAVARQQVREAHDVEVRPDGSIVLSLEVTDRTAFRTFVLGFLDHAEVLAPQALRDDIVTWLRDLADRVPPIEGEP